jgi:small subunit ribosomal protein S2
MEEPQGEELLVPLDQYLACGIHIGTQIATSSMKPFIYRVRNDGLYVLDVRTTDLRIKAAAKFLSRYEPDRILVVSARAYGFKPIEAFASTIRCKAISRRFIPGTLTNPNIDEYLEPDVIMITDPRADRQALKEALHVGIPVIALCDTDNGTKNVDIVIPANNKGRRALSLIFWLLAREILKERGEIASNEDFKVSLSEFESKVRREQ